MNPKATLSIEAIYLNPLEVTSFGDATPCFVPGQPELKGTLYFSHNDKVDVVAGLTVEESQRLKELQGAITTRLLSEFAAKLNR